MTVRFALAERGVALVLVLWMLMLLTLIANGVAMTSRTETQVAGHLVSSARAEAAADAAIHRAIAELLAPAGTAGRWKTDGREYRWSFDDMDIRVWIRDEAAKVDLNNAPPELLSGLFRAAGVEPDIAQALADAVLDWRDPDGLRHLHGAEHEDYVAAGKNHGPANASFESVEELRLVLGVTPEIFRTVSPHLTIYSQSGSINAGTADRLVLLALPGATPEMVDSFIEQRHAVLEQGLPPPPFPLAPSTPASEQSYHAILAHARSGDNTHFSREAVVHLIGDAAKPFIIFAWRSPTLEVPTPSNPLTPID